MSGQPIFFELGVGDAERAHTFYGSLFGWAMSRVPPGDGFTIDAGGVRGGLHGGDAGASPYLFFGVADIDTALERVRALGGTVEDTDVEGDAASTARHGRFKLCRDDQGSSFGLHQPPAA